MMDKFFLSIVSVIAIVALVAITGIVMYERGSAEQTVPVYDGEGNLIGYSHNGGYATVSGQNTAGRATYILPTDPNQANMVGNSLHVKFSVEPGD